MKTTLTIEQSAELIKRGVNPDKASMVCMDFNGTYVYVSGEETQTVRDCVNGQFYVEESRVFILSDLLSLLPKTINNGNYYLDLSYGFGDWTVSYILWDSCDEETYIEDTQGEKTEKELVDALYELLLWCLDNPLNLTEDDERGIDR